jgi:hypothetical protein
MMEVFVMLKDKYKDECRSAVKMINPGTASNAPTNRHSTLILTI